MSENQHRWRLSLDPRRLEFLDDTAKRLETSWDWDRANPESFPINTEFCLSEAKGALARKFRDAPRLGKMPPRRAETKSIHDLIDERTVRSVYEQQNAGSYSQALKAASQGYGRGFAAWRKIVKSVTAAYLVDFGGTEFIPKPKVNVLHRGLLEVARILELDELTSVGLLEFFDDLCPCGKKHNSEAIRKLGKRIKKSR